MLLLRDAAIEPTPVVLSGLMGEIYPVFEEFLRKVTGEPFGLEPVWKYYRDGNAWLCKIITQKKTIAWLSIWEGFFKVTVYFTAKYTDEIIKLPLDDKLLEEFLETARLKKNPHFTIEINKKEQLEDLIKIMRFKMSCK